MKKTLKHISPFQFGKVSGAIYGLMSLIFVPFFLIFAVVGSLFPSDQSKLSPLIVIVGALILSVLFPIFYAIMGFLLGALGALVYNLTSKWVGGIEVDVE